MKKLIEKRAALLARCKELTAAADVAGRAMTEEERTEFRSKMDEAGSLKAQIADLEALAAEETEQTAIEARSAAQPSRPTPRVEVHDLGEDAPFESLGEQLMAVRAVAESQRTVFDPRLRKYDLTNLKVRAASGLQEGVGTDGGFLVGQDRAEVMAKTAFDTGVLAAKTKKIPISNNSNGVKIPYVDETSRANGSRWGGVRAYWQNEAVATTSSKPKPGIMDLGLNKLMALVYATDEMLADASVLDAWINQAVTEEFAFALDDAIVRGPGAGVPLGILNAACTVSVAKETSQAAATILYANVSKMRARMLPRSFAKAEWYINIDCMPQLETLFAPHKNVAGTENVSGQSVWIPARGAQDPPNGTLFGRPVNVIEHAETCGTVGDIILADLGMYLQTTKGGVNAASSIHVNFLTDETAFRFTMRTDGQPALKSALTPYKGSGTLSAFVTLATR